MELISPSPFRQRSGPVVDYDPAWRTSCPLRVLLVRTPLLASRLSLTTYLAPPLGVAYIAAALRQAGHSVQVIDAVGEDPDHPQALGNGLIRYGLSDGEIVDRVDLTPDVIGISCTFSNEWPLVRESIRRLKQAFPGAFVIGGGEHFTASPEECLRSCPELSACVMGEGEGALLEALEAVSSGASLERSAGLVFRGPRGSLHRTQSRGRIRNIDDLPLPAWDLVPLEKYLDRELSGGTQHGRSIPMLATRGCPYQCTFCSNLNMWTTRWVPRDPAKVLDEFELWQKRYRVNDIQFFDLTAIIRKEWILRFADEIERRGLRITWQIPIGTRSEAVDGETARALRRSGCFYISYAPESGSVETLRRIKKMVNLGNMKNSMRASLKEGLTVKCHLMLGVPGETHQQVWQTLKLAFGLSWLGVHDITLFPFAPYPGTPLYEKLLREDKLPGLFMDEWYASISYNDFFALKSYSEHFSLRALRFYQFLGFVLFYGTTFLFRPGRLLRLAANLLTGRHDTKGATALRNILGRVFRRYVDGPLATGTTASLEADPQP